MKVKEVIEKLSKCDQELEAAYEHCYIDYVQEKPQEGIVEMGGMRATTYSRWIPVAKRHPEEGDFPIVVALKTMKGWMYVISYDSVSFNDSAEELLSEAQWMSIPPTKEHLEQILRGE